MDTFTAVVFLASFALSVLLAKPVIRRLHELKFGQKILEDGPTWHIGKENTPTMGGVIFIAACAFGVLCAATRMAAAYDWRPLVMLGLSLIFGAIGFADDWTKIRHNKNKGITARQKLLLQIAAAALFLTAMRVLGYFDGRLYLPFFRVWAALPWAVYLILCVLIIVGADNAVNLTDGIDGLCSSVTLIVSLFFTAVFLRQGSGAVWFSAALSGGLLGFFLFNKHPAQTFMGDTGSLFLGGAVCAMAFAADMPLMLVPVGIVYILETLSDIIQVVYFRATGGAKHGGKRFFKMAPLHHHLELCGWSEWKIVLIADALTAALCAVSYFFG